MASDYVDFSCFLRILEKPKILPSANTVFRTPRVELQLTPSTVIEGVGFYCAASAGYAGHEISKNGFLRNKETGYITRGSLNSDEGYSFNIRSTVDGKTRKRRRYQIMAIVFLGPAPTPRHTVDHLDRIHWNDVLSNLAWATKEEQSANQTRPKFHSKAKPVTAICPRTGQELASFSTIARFFECPRMNLDNMPYNKKNAQCIRAACKAGRITHGYRWKYCMESLPGEIWRNLEVTGGTIKVSNKGRIVNFIGCITNGWLNRQGYKTVSLYSKQYRIHRLVMAAFHGEDKTRVVNHKDGDKTNNKLENLEYLTIRENAIHAIQTGLKVVSKRIQQVDPWTGRIIAEFASGAEAGRAVNRYGSYIIDVCNGIGNSSGGFWWQWAQ